jgi:hypothetical protein
MAPKSVERLIAVIESLPNLADMLSVDTKARISDDRIKPSANPQYMSHIIWASCDKIFVITAMVNHLM